MGRILVPDRSDIKLIMSNTSVGESAAVLHEFGWTFLVEAQRAPKFYFLPSTGQLTYRFVDKSLQDMNAVFVERSFLDGNRFVRVNPKLESIIMPFIKKNFEVEGESKNLILLRKKKGGSEPSSYRSSTGDQGL